MQQLRYIHRYATILVALFLLFLGVTGTIIQTIDLRSILADLPATDANVRAMRESFDGPPDFVVRRTDDYLARPLPAVTAYPAMLDRVVRAARAKLGGQAFKYVELRMAGDVPVGQVGIGNGYARFDALSGALIEQVADEPLEDQAPASQRNTVKRLHRMTSFGNWALYINIGVSVALATLIVTGLLIYCKLLAQRRRIGRRALFWPGGGNWRYLHRVVSLACAAFLIVVVISGAWLAIESLYRSFDVSPPPAAATKAPPRRPDASSPLDDTRLPAMLRTTLAAARDDLKDVPVKVVRLRNYARYGQGVIVTGGDASRQLVFDAQTGAAMSETEPGYPKVHFPFGWQAHQWAKSLHRGDVIGLGGRWMDLIAGLAMIYLSISGLVMYWQMWQRRRRGGRGQLIWR